MTDWIYGPRPGKSSDGIDDEIAEIARGLAGSTMSAAVASGEKRCALAFDRMLGEHRLTKAAAIAAPLSAAFPRSTYFTHMALAFATLPPPCEDADFAAWTDDPAAEVQVVRRAGAHTVLLGFCGNQNKMSLPLDLMHRWFGQVDVHAVYLRDLSQRGYMSGIAGLGADHAATVDGLQALVTELAPERVVCQGHSGGGYAALRMGLGIGADAVLAFGAQTNPVLNIAQVDRIRSILGIGAGVDLADHLGSGTDMARVYAAAPVTPRARLVFSGGHPRDVAQAVAMDGLLGVTLEAVGDHSDHGVFYHVLRSGRYREQLAELVTPSTSAGRT